MTKISRVLLAAAVAVALVACTSTVVRKPQASRTPAPHTKAPPPGASAVVRRGDTLYGIAFRNGLDVRDVAAWNGIGPPYTIYPGQRLRLSPRTGSATGAGTVATGASTPARPPSATPTPSRPPSRPPAVTSTPGRPSVATAPSPGAGVVTPQPAPTNTLAWRWPAEGALLNRFLAGEPTRQGIDIAGDGGAPVHAAADGVVVYSGSGLVGYGELIIVKHNDAWLSAYGHNRARMVNEGTIVKAGQQIAVMGRTGAPRDMLHFEIRYNGKPVDPLTYLPRR